MARAPCCSDKAAALMVSAGLAIGRVCGEEHKLQTVHLPLRALKTPELVQGNAMGSSCQGEGDGRKQSMESSEPSHWLSMTVENPRSPRR